MIRLLFGFVLILALVSIANADDSTFVDTTLAPDTVIYRPIGAESSAQAVSDSTDYEQRLIQNPTAALFKSMIVPGLGQVGNRKFFKAAVVIGLQTWLISSVIEHGQDASDFNDKFETSTDIAERNLWYDRYLQSKDQRNKYTWFAVLVAFFSMFDAYSDAHLSGFPKDKKENDNNFSLNIRPLDKDGLYASVAVSF